MTMMKTIKKLLIFLMLALPVVVAADYLFKTLEARDGLTSSQVNCILKDSRGYMWFGTPAGLYRFDGYTFRNFQSDSQNGSSLSDSYINSIQETLDGNLLIETASGYCIYHPQTESFERDMKQAFARFGIETIPSVVYVDKHKNLWGAIPNKGVVCYNQQQQLLYEFGYTDDTRGVPQGVVCSISECKEGALIVYDDGKIACCDVMHQQNTLWVVEGIPALRNHKTKSLRAFADQNDNIWLYGQGTLVMYDKQKGDWDYTVSQRLGVTGLGVDRNINGMAGNADNIWIGSDQLGLLRMDPKTYETESVQPRNINEKQLITDNVSIQSVYMDDTGLLWVGTEKSGVAYTGKYIYRFGSNLLGDVTAMAQHADGSIWYGTSDKGVIGFNGQLASLKVSCMGNTPDGSIWIGSKRNGLTRIKDGVSTIYSVAKDSVRTIIDDHINDLTTDKIGNLWIATNGGLQVYNPRVNQFSNYTKKNGKIRVNNITSLFYTSSNNMLIGTSEGLIIMNISTTEMRQYTGNSTNLSKYTNNYVTQVFEDSRGLIWVGTREGVNIWNPNNDHLDYLTEKNGLCNNNICGIAEDASHNVWLSTSNGVSRVVIQRNHENDTYNYGLYNYTRNDGLQGDEFNIGSILIRRDGNVVMGGLNGINWIRPKTIDETVSLPRVMLTQLFIGEEEILVGHSYNGNIPLTQALNESSRIQLKSDQNTITIKFAAGNYNQSERLQFMYEMEGLDNDWHDGDALKHGVTFTDLSPGTYKLHVKAVSAEGAVSNQERVIEIVVARPWFLQWWMIGIYALILIIVIYMWKQGMDRIRLLWKKKKAILGELVQQREEIKSASDDLRQPMSRMTTIIMNLSEKESTLEEREQLNALHAQMLQLITRVSDMQTILENPEERAKKAVQKHFEINAKGEMSLPDLLSEELTSEIRPYQAELPTAKFRVVFVDSNVEFIKFIKSHLKFVYEFHTYNDIHKAATDIESMMPDLVICKQDMPKMTGSELCNNIKMHPTLNRIKFVLMTDNKLSPQEMTSQNITMGADDYLAKPFNLQEAVMRFNKLLGVGPIEIKTDLIEGAETRELEGRNSSMTTATESMDLATYNPSANDIEEDEQMKSLAIQIVRDHTASAMEQNYNFTDDQDEMHEKYSMTESMDQQLINSIEQYVQQNMNRGTINLEDMAEAMGMSMKPFFQKVHDITGKTPAEIVRDLRLRHACILLQRTNINMSELASHVGFATGEHFINLFKERFGMTPSEYRLKHRK